MPNLFDPNVQRAMKSRVDTLTAAAQPRWGKMNVGQMVVHCTKQLQIGLGELTCEPFETPAGRFPLKQLIIYLLPTPRSVPTMPELRDPVTKDWEQDRSALMVLIDRFGAIPPGTTMPVHAAFGTLSRNQWGLLAGKHLDHHLTQFGA